jgi:hypothetical protein
VQQRIGKQENGKQERGQQERAKQESNQKLTVVVISDEGHTHSLRWSFPRDFIMLMPACPLEEGRGERHGGKV